MNHTDLADPVLVEGLSAKPWFELVTTVERFAELETPWGALWQQTQALAFQSHPWLAAWVRDMGSSYKLSIGLLWKDHNNLAAVLPMAVRSHRWLRILEWAGQLICDYCGGLGSVADLQTVWQALQQTQRVDIVRLKNIPAERQITALFDPDKLAPDDACLKVQSQWASGDAWFRTLNKKKKNNFNRGMRILESFGATSIVCHEGIPDDALLRRLLELKKVWLATTGQSSYLVNDANPDLLLRLTRALAQLGRLRLFVIRCGDDVVSASINIADGPSIGAFFAAYDSRFDRASPGIMLMTAYTQWAFNNGFTEIDYLRGDEGYKLEFANARSTLLSYSSASNVVGHLAVAAHRGWLLISKLREKHTSEPGTGGAYRTKAGTERAPDAAD